MDARHQDISSHSADWILIILEQFHKEVTGNNTGAQNYVLKKCAVVQGLIAIKIMYVWLGGQESSCWCSVASFTDMV